MWGQPFRLPPPFRAAFPFIGDFAVATLFIRGTAGERSPFVPSASTLHGEEFRRNGIGVCAAVATTPKRAAVPFISSKLPCTTCYFVEHNMTVANPFQDPLRFERRMPECIV